MKKITNVKISQILYLAVAFLGMVTAQSCKKEDPNAEGASGSAKVKLINASADAGPSKLFIDGDVRVEDAVSAGNASVYRGAFAGEQEITVHSASDVILAKVSLDLQGSGYYSFFLTGNSGSYNVIALLDNWDPAASGKAKVRFVQASSNLSAANLALNGSALFTAQAYKGVSAYTEVTPGAYTLSITNADNPTVLATNTLAKFEAGKNYTVYTSGSATAALSVNVTANN